MKTVFWSGFFIVLMVGLLAIATAGATSNEDRASKLQESLMRLEAAREQVRAEIFALKQEKAQLAAELAALRAETNQTITIKITLMPTSKPQMKVEQE